MVSVSKSTLIGIGLNLVLGAVLLYTMYTARGGVATPTARKAVYRVAFVELEHSDSADLVLTGIKDATTKDGRSLVEVTVLDANNDKIKLQTLADQAVAGNYDLIVPFCSLASQQIKEMAAKRHCPAPIVFCGVGDPVKCGLIEETGKPAANMTGFGVFGFDFVKPMIEQLPLFAPKAKNILMPYNPTMLGGTLEEYHQHIRAELEQRGYTVKDIKIYNTNEVVEKIQPFMADIDMVWLLPDHTTLEALEGIGKLCNQYQKFTYVTMNLNKLGQGAALAFGYSLYDTGYDVGTYIYRILEKGEKVNTLPVLPVRVDRLKIGINIETARKQGLLAQIDPTTLYLMEHGVVYQKAI